MNARKVIQSAFPKDIDLSRSNPEHSGKLEVLSQLLENVFEESKGKEKIVLVSNYTQVSKTIEAHLSFDFCAILCLRRFVQIAPIKSVFPTSVYK